VLYLLSYDHHDHAQVCGAGRNILPGPMAFRTPQSTAKRAEAIHLVQITESGRPSGTTSSLRSMSNRASTSGRTCPTG
jgi:hypothetical protein